MEYEADGSFWIDDPADAVRGRLSFTQVDGGDLRLEAILARSGDPMASVELTRGQALDGTQLCLMNTFPTELRVGTAMPVHPHRYFVNHLLVGADQPGLPIQAARIALHRLLDFTDYSGLSVTGSGSARDEPISVGWEPPDDRPSATVDGIEVSIATEHAFTGEDYEFSIAHRAEIELRDAAGRAIEHWSTPAFWIEGLISFLLGSPLGSSASMPRATMVRSTTSSAPRRRRWSSSLARGRRAAPCAAVPSTAAHETAGRNFERG